MHLIKSCMIAVAMYSRIPVPQVEWSEENMRYSLGFFPAVGIAVGVLEFIWYRISGRLGVTNLFYAVTACMIPILVTGGIHMDGFCDTEDALCSCRPKETKLLILKDPHTGAFAVIRCGMYLLAYTGAMSMVDSLAEIKMVAVGFVLSRVFSGLAAVTFPGAKKDGSLASFSNASHRGVVCGILIMTGTVCAVLMVLNAPAVGIVTVAAVLILFFYYYQMAKRQFGGITGDLEGWFLEVCELVIVLAVTVGTALLELLPAEM